MTEIVIPQEMVDAAVESIKPHLEADTEDIWLWMHDALDAAFSTLLAPSSHNGPLDLHPYGPITTRTWPG